MLVRSVITFVIAIITAWPAVACSICGDGFARRQPLRSHYTDATIVLFGQLKNPRPAADGIGGTTEFHVSEILKRDPKLAIANMLTVPRYLPIIGNTPPDYLFFCTFIDGKFEFVHGMPATMTTITYLKEAAKLDPKTPAKSLPFFFRHLDSKDEATSADAFLEFARAADADITASAAGFDRIKLRTWIADATVPDDRVGVYALLLGLTGKPDDVAFLAGLLSISPRPERYFANLGGLHAGLTLLDADLGWKLTTATLTDVGRPFTEKLNAFGTLRYFQATRPKESRARLLTCYRSLIEAGDLSDLAIDDLRRWAWWDLTDVIIAQYGKPTHAAIVVRRGIVRYALTCPKDEAKSFITTLRASEPTIVKTVEDGLKAYEVKPARK